MKSFLSLTLLILTFSAIAMEGHLRTLNISDTTIKYYEISCEKAEYILIEKSGVLNKEFSKPKMSKVYDLNDGTLLVFGKKKCFVYLKAEDVKMLLNNGITKNHILYRLNYYGANLPLMETDAKKNISEFLNIPLEKLDFSLTSFDIIDQGLYEKYENHSYTEEELLKNVIYFITYAGAAYNKEYNGSWLMILDNDDKETWQPYNLDNNGQKLDLYTWIFSSLCNVESDEVPSVSSGFYSRVKKKR